MMVTLLHKYLWGIDFNQTPTRRTFTMDKKNVQAAVLAGICVMLSLTGIGFIRIPPMAITYVHLPVILGTIIIGKKQGLFLGFVFGLCSIYQNAVMPTSPISFVFLNPLVSVLPRVLIPVMVILTMEMLNKTKMNTTTKVAISAGIGSITNTVVVLAMIYFIYAAQYAQKLAMPVDAVIGALVATACVNGIPECIFMIILTVALYKALKREIAI